MPKVHVTQNWCSMLEQVRALVTFKDQLAVPGR
jgi:hypothetical protein